MNSTTDRIPYDRVSDDELVASKYDCIGVEGRVQ